jgi:hypothetical protein
MQTKHESMYINAIMVSSSDTFRARKNEGIIRVTSRVCQQVAQNVAQPIFCQSKQIAGTWG